METKLTTNKTLFTGIVLGLLILIVMVTVTYRQNQYANNTADLVAHKMEELYRTEKVLSTITDNETGSRGFIITGQHAFLAPVVTSKATIHQEIAGLKQMATGNPNKQQLIDSLLFYSDKRIIFSDSTIALRKERGIEAAAQLVSTGRGKLYVDKIRQLVAAMQGQANAALKKQQAENTTAVATEKIVLMASTFMILALMLIIFWREKQRTEEQVKKKTQEQLAFLSLQINQSNDAIYTMDEKRKIQSWNKGAEELYGFTEEEALGRESIEFLKTDITSEEVAMALIEISEHDYWKGELKRITKTGKTIYVHASTSSIKDKDGNITGYVAVSYDITRQKKLYEQVNHLANIVEQSSEAIFSRDTNHQIISWNKGAENLFGYSKEEAIGKKPSALGFIRLSPEEISAIEKRVIENGNWKAEMYYYHKDGSSFFGAVTANLIKNEKGENTSFYFIVKDISTRKKMEEHLKGINEELEIRVQERTQEILQREKRFRALIDNNNDIISLLDKSFTVVYRSPSGKRIMGWSDEEIENSNGTKNVHPDDMEYAKLVVQQVMDNPGKSINTLCRLLHKEGHYLWMEGTVVNMLHDENINAIVFNYRDVTQRAEAEKKLAASEMRFRLLIENSIEGIAISDQFSNNIYRSPGAEKITGLLPKENAISLTHPDDLAMIKAKREEVVQNPGVPIAFQARFRHALGHYFWMEGTFTNMLHVEGINAVVTNFRDITKRKELEDLLHKANTLARIGGWEIDLIKGTVYWSDITRELHETAVDYMPNLETGLNFYKEGKGRDLITQKVKEAIELGQPWDVELQIITAKNNERWIRSIGQTEFVHEKCVRIYGSFQDIDQRKKAEEKIKNLNIELEEKVIIRTEQLKKSNEELEAFSYSVSHDLRAPLRAIIGYSNILEEDYGSKLDDEAKRITGVIKRNTQKMGYLIDDLLAFSRMGRHELLKTNIDTNEIVNEIKEELARLENEDKKISWVIHKLPVAKADFSTIRQVWVNLLSNALKYSSKSKNPSIEVGSFNQNGQIVFYVKDNGVGFDEKYKNKLFKVFQRLHSADEFEGTGIGLAIVDKIISKHGGQVWANAVVNNGASFYFSLPEN